MKSLRHYQQKAKGVQFPSSEMFSEFDTIKPTKKCGGAVKWHRLRLTIIIILYNSKNM